MKKTIYFLLCTTLIASCKKANEEKKNDTATKVEISEVQLTKTVGALHYSGTVEAFKTIPLSFQTTGTIKKMLVDAGDLVRKGQLLATVDKADAQNMYDISLSKYKQAKDAYNRLKEVHDKGSLTDIKWVEMETNLAQAESSVAIAKNALDKCNLYSPENGIIGSRNAEPGMSVLSNLKAPLELVKIEQVYVTIAVPENEISKIRKGAKASFRVSALNDRIFEGTITQVGVVANDISRTYEVKILVKNPELALKPGMVCDVNLNIQSEKEVMTVPFQAVGKDDDGNAYVFVVDAVNHTVTKKTVQAGNFENNNIEILSGLNPGEKVVKSGKEKVSDHSKIDF